MKLKEWLVRNILRNMMLITIVRCMVVFSVLPFGMRYGWFYGFLIFLAAGMAVEGWRIWAQGHFETLKLIAAMIKTRRRLKNANNTNAK